MMYNWKSIDSLATGLVPASNLRCIYSSHFYLALVIFLHSGMANSASSTCEPSREINVNVELSRVIRSDAPKTLFGFNVPWRDFQEGYMKNGKIKSELVEYLKPFPDAVYRYPGGSPSNSFEWKKSVGPIETRPAIHSDYHNFAKPRFGIDEFVSFVNRVHGKALFTVNVKGPYKKTWTDAEVAKDIKDLLTYVRYKTVFGCVGGTNCPVIGWELGNEVDWPPNSWSAERYAVRVNNVLNSLSGFEESVWIAAGKTAPWEPILSKNFKKFNAELSEKLENRVSGISMHPYYDGIDIPTIGNYIRAFERTWPRGEIYITEHGRWPSQPAVGRWESNWYQASGLGGAISAVDFMLSIMPNKNIKVSVWHALSVLGPWQLIRLDKSSQQLYPSTIYWGLRVIREAYLDHIIFTKYISPHSNEYSGKYTIRLVAMASNDGSKVSLLGVNRSSDAQMLKIQTNNAHGKSLVFRWITSKEQKDENSNKNKNKIVMKTSISEIEGSGFKVCIPPNSIFSMVRS